MEDVQQVRSKPGSVLKILLKDLKTQHDPLLLDGLDLSADLLRGEAIQPALADDHQDGEDDRQSQHGRLKLPEEMLLHQGGATAGRRRGTVSVSLH